MSLDALRAAYQALRQAVPPARKKAHVEEGTLAATVRVGIQIWDAMKAQGVPLSDRVATLEKTLRQVWPFTREWKYLCQPCFDTGLRMSECPGDATCGRHQPHLAHDVGTPCWCSLGARFKHKPRPSAEDFTAAGKSKPTRVGRA